MGKVMRRGPLYRLIPVIIISALTLAGCDMTDMNFLVDDYKETEVKMKNGDIVTCLEHELGIDCDWDGAVQSSDVEQQSS